MNTYSISTRLFGLCLLGLVLTMTACKKETEIVNPIDGGSAPAFVDKNLRITAVTSDPLIDIDGDGKLDKDLLPYLRPCDLDNTIRFEKSGRLSGNSGSNNCNDGSEQASDSKPGTWTYDGKSHILRLITTVDSKQNVAEWEILEESASGLKAKVSAQGSTDDFRLVMTWRAQ
ncbi:hypothetical protein IC229_15105 [Spirosoma sp. BT702]|uniref:Lipocalin-like domain-containing protein n=1 Tax=Spirosoma profusum TaxID=2771354 RepID=A0A926Y3M7_9BACT|nr:hypothetical protein [Spirosoma profusum]MBD2701976.1 hypothetical protein [Spirosoma profusum]